VGCLVTFITHLTYPHSVSFVVKIDQYQAMNSAAETPAERESPERVSRVMSGVSEPKSGAESPTKSREAAPPAHTTSGNGCYKLMQC